MKITIESRHVPTVLMLRHSAPAGVFVRTTPTMMQRSIGSDELAVAIISVAATVPLGLLVNWLYDNIKDKPAKLTINRTQVDIEHGEITRVIHEEITKE